MKLRPSQHRTRDPCTVSDVILGSRFLFVELASTSKVYILCTTLPTISDGKGGREHVTQHTTLISINYTINKFCM